MSRPSDIRGGLKPERLSPTVEIRSSQRDGEGRCHIDPASRLVTKIAIPQADTAAGRTVRMHEICHARYSGVPGEPGVRTDLVGQIVEDMYVHYHYYPGDCPTAHRDALATALTDSRQGSFYYMTEGQRLGMICRNLAIVSRYEQEMGVVLPARYRKTVGTYSQKLLAVAKQVLAAVAQNQKEEAYAILDRHIKSPQERMIDMVSVARNIHILEPSRMAIHELPLTHPCDPAMGDTRPSQLVASGRRLRMSRVVRRLSDDSPNASPKVYSRKVTTQVREGSGTVLIDASGSMMIGIERLIQLSMLAPGSCVAYYCGGQCDSRYSTDYDGVLYVTARNGRRADCVEWPYCVQGVIQAGNDVDWPAVQWLMNQPKPWYFVTDEKFCGDTLERYALLRGAINTQPIKIIHSIDEALELFTQTGR